jgi:predicted enzyme involved in methoxymalonyl-ACP biosynthesis
MKAFAQLQKNLKKDFSGLAPVKVALLGDTATQFLCQALRGQGFENGFDLQIWEADFNQVERQVFDPSSDLYAFVPDVVIVFQSTHKLLNRYNKSAKEKSSFASDEITFIKKIYQTLNDGLSTKIIL